MTTVNDSLLTRQQAFRAMVCFLEAYYERTQADEVGGLLGDLMLLGEGITADPAAWPQWQACVQRALAEAPADGSA